MNVSFPPLPRKTIDPLTPSGGVSWRNPVDDDIDGEVVDFVLADLHVVAGPIRS